MLLTDSYAIVPGLTTSRETYENEFRWGQHAAGLWSNALISGSATDTGNTGATTTLRPGLVLGQITASGKYTTYSPTASDGSEVASAVLVEGLKMTDFNGTATDRFYAVLVGGPVQASKLLNLDLQARQQMDKFIFDDIGQIVGNHWFPWKRFVTKTADYTIVAGDNFTIFDNTGASGTVILTLPAIANGYLFGFRATAAQIIRATSAEGSNLIGSSLTQTSASVTAIGGIFYVYSNPGATKWIVEQHGTQTITFA